MLNFIQGLSRWYFLANMNPIKMPSAYKLYFWLRFRWVSPRVCSRVSNSSWGLPLRGFYDINSMITIGAISWTDISSAWSLLSIFKILARWHPVQKSYSRLKFNGNHARYKLCLKAIFNENMWHIFQSNCQHWCPCENYDCENNGSDSSLHFEKIGPFNASLV